MPIVVLPLAVLGRGRHWLRLVVTAGLVAVVVVNIYELRRWPAPVRPPAAYVAGGLVVGAALGGWVATRWARQVTVRRQPSYGAAYGAATVIAVTALLGVFADGYVGREVKQQPRPGDDPFRVASVIGWLDRQPEWADGDQPVAAGPIVDALLAGPRLTHHLTLIPQTESCASVRALHVGHWLVFAKSIVVASGPYQFITYTRADCITGPPSYADGHYLVYRPANRS
jgi:hypothetical protein